MKEQASGKHLTADETLLDLLNHPAFAGFGPLLLPWDDRGYDNSLRLRNVGSLLPYHSHVDPRTVVSALNHMIDDVNNGKTIFYEFYTGREEGAADEVKDGPVLLSWEARSALRGHIPGRRLFLRRLRA